MEPSDPATELSTAPPQLAALLVEIRDLYQKSLIDTANARQYLERSIKSASDDVEEESRRFSPSTVNLNRYSRAWNEYGETGGSQSAEVEPPKSLEEAKASWNERNQRCALTLDEYQADRAQYEAGRRRLFRKPKVEPRIPDGFRIDLWAMKAILDALPGLQREYVQERITKIQRDLTSAFEFEVRGREAAMAIEMDRLKSALTFGIEVLGHLAFPWPEALAEAQKAPVEHEQAIVRLGRFESIVPEVVAFEVPAVIEFPSQRALAIEAPAAKRDVALSVVRSVVLRTLTAIPAGQMQLSIFDPVALGQSFADFLHLGDYDERLVDTKPRTSARDIESRLEEHAAHLELVIGKYLRGQYASIRDYNQQALEVAEPYRLLVVCDYPAQFTDRSTELLLSLIENGARCGVHVLIHFDPDALAQGQIPRSRLLRSADCLTWQGQNLQVELTTGPLGLNVVPDQSPSISFGRDSGPDSDAARFLAALGTRARSVEERVVDLSQCFELLARSSAGGAGSHLPVLKDGAPPVRQQQSETWWSGNSTTGATALLGRAGAQSVAPLFFSSTEIAGGALMVGLPRSGKTTALHCTILTLAMTYGPSELELYLIDAKHGVEFNIYRNLPHARMVAINNEREFAVAILASLDREIARRAELMKTHTPGRTNVQEYRRATGETLPRIIVVVDEFHEVFEEDDRLGQEAFSAFSNIVRQGPFAGVHLVLASQTLSSMPAMDRNTLTLLPARIAFACNESDGQIVMGEDNDDFRFLSRAGEGLLNPNRGDPVHNVRFQGAFVAPDDRDVLLRQLSVKAAQLGWMSRPRVFDGDALADRSLVAPTVFSEPDDKPNRIRFVLGEPLTLDEHLPVALRRADGQNILLLAPVDDEGVPESGLLGVVHSMLLAASQQVPDTHLVDLVSDEGGTAPGGDRVIALAELCDSFGVSSHRRRGLSDLILETANLVRERLELEDYHADSRLLILVGAQRASDLNPEDYDEDSLAANLRLILRDGPEVGVHTVVIADTLANVYRRLGTDCLDDVAFRIAGRLPTDQDRQQVLDLYHSMDLRGNQLVLFDRDRDQRLKFRPYGPITEGWLTLASLDAQIEESS